MGQETSKYGTKLRNLESTHPADYARIVRHFGEEYFTKKLNEDPDNPLNYILLAKVYSRKQDMGWRK